MSCFVRRFSLTVILGIGSIIIISIIAQNSLLFFNSALITNPGSNTTSPLSMDVAYTRTDIVTFTNVTSSVGLGGVSGNFFAWGDYNNDDNQDLLVNGGRLFRNNGQPDHTFTEVTGAVGISGGGNGAWADYDNDGYLDFYCTGKDTLYHNEGPPEYKFKDVTVAAGNVSDDYPTTAIGWCDYDLDGFVDMYITNGEDWNDGDPVYYPDFLYHNNGDGTFTDVTAEAGIRNFGGPYYGRGVAWCDYDDDGWPDVYISNYRISQNWLFHNNRNGTFIDVALEKGVAGEESQRVGNTYYGHTVGSAWADLDNDGDLDLFESDLAHKDLYRGPICGDSQLYRNNGASSQFTFTDVRSDSGIPEKNIGGGEDELFVGIAVADFDNDGFCDLFIPQIYDLEYSYSYLYHNNGDWTFTNVSDETGILVWNTYGGAWCDYDNDGFLDLVTGGKGSPEPNTTYEVHLYNNNGNQNSWLQVKLAGNHYNWQGIGVRVKVTANGFSQTRELEGGMGCHSMQNSIPVEFGFGSYSGTAEVEVFWPSGYVQKLEDVQLNQLLKIEEPTLTPDLTFINVNVLEPHPVQGEIVTIEASVVNMGYLMADRAVVRFYDVHAYDGTVPGPGGSGTEIAEAQTITGLDKFNSVKLTTTWDTTDQAGEHDIWVVIEDVEPGEIIITNNAINVSVSIRAENQNPIASLIATPQEDLSPGDYVTFDASNSSDDIAIEYYNFDFGDGNTSRWIVNSIITYQYHIHGKFTASLHVKDTDNEVSTNSAQVLISILAPPQPNRTPEIESFTANPYELQPFEKTKLKIIAHDPDNDELIYHFDSVHGELVGNEHNSAATWEAPEQEGLYEISAKVFDGEEFSEAAFLTITVTRPVTNHAPVINDIDIDPLDVTTKSSVSITVRAYDPDADDELSYIYETTGGSIIGIGSEVTWLAPVEPGLYTITVLVSDLGGLSTEQEITLIVTELNYPPEVVNAEVDPETIKNDRPTSILFTVDIYDKNGLFDITDVTIDLSPLDGKSNQELYDNGRHGDADGSDGIFSYEYTVSSGLSEGRKEVEVTIMDQALSEVTYELTIEVVAGGGSDLKDDSPLPGFGGEGVIMTVVLVSFMIYFSKKKKIGS